MNEWDELERFDNRGARVSGSTIKITNQLALYFSSGFLHKANAQVGTHEYCVLYYSPIKKAIVIDFVEDPQYCCGQNEDSALKMTIKRSCAQVSARSFFHHNMINVEANIGKAFTPQLTFIPKLEKHLWTIFLDD